MKRIVFILLYIFISFRLYAIDTKDIDSKLNDIIQQLKDKKDSQKIYDDKSEKAPEDKVKIELPDISKVDLNK